MRNEQTLINYEYLNRKAQLQVVKSFLQFTHLLSIFKTEILTKMDRIKMLNRQGEEGNPI